MNYIPFYMIRPFTRIIFTAVLLFSGLLQSQSINFPINNHDGQNIETCSGTFSDSGGDTLTYYGNNENYSITFTAQNDTEEPQYIKLNFRFFELGQDDFLYIHDGADENADLIATGSGTSLLGEQIWSTGSSLHVRFVSSEADTARGWWADIACFELCDAFYADITTDQETFDFCPEAQTVNFQADADYYGGEPEGSLTNITYQWNFDGELKDGPQVSHDYEDPGAYPFRLIIEDPQNSCMIDTIITVRLATVPNFNNTIATADTVCSEEVFSLLGNVNAIPWTGFPTVVDTVAFVGEGEVFASSLVFDVFPDEQQIVFEEDFDRVCINIEHMDFGDLTFELQCPNGSSVVLHDISPGGAHLGEPVVLLYNETPGDIPGIGYEYCFTTAPQYGLMSETTFQFYNYTDQAGDLYFNQPYLPEGSYTPVESFQNLIGCPLNGEWTVTVEDSVTGTSGHVMGWSMFFNEDFYPDSLIFTPEIVEEKWFDQSGNELGNNPVSTSIETDVLDDFEFTFRATDNFGCTWDTTLVITAQPLPKAEIVSELEIPICEGDSTILTVQPELIGDEIHWLYQWMLEGEELEGRIFDTILAKEVANYMVRVTDTITGCAGFFELAVTEQNCDLNIPNVFTPNNDGINDVFEIENLEHYPGSVMVIYNRNGKKVFEHNDYYLNWWDGSNQAEGTYYYVITYTRQGERKQTQGVITLIR